MKAHILAILIIGAAITSCSLDSVANSLKEMDKLSSGGKDGSSSSGEGGGSPSTSCGGSGFAGTSGTFTDARDGKSYRYVQIGTQTWMAENLNYNASGSKCYGEGGYVPGNDPSTGEWNSEATLSPAEIQANCATYGRLYDWATAMALPPNCNSSISCASQINSKHTGICPSGWHIPSEADWRTLARFADPSCNAPSYEFSCPNAGGKLKASCGWDWNDYDNYDKSGNGTDDFGFAALPGGDGFTGDYTGVGKYGSWWSAQNSGGCQLTMNYINEFAYYYRLEFKNALLSVRCLKD